MTVTNIVFSVRLVEIASTTLQFSFLYIDVSFRSKEWTIPAVEWRMSWWTNVSIKRVMVHGQNEVVLERFACLCNGSSEEFSHTQRCNFLWNNSSESTYSSRSLEFQLLLLKSDYERKKTWFGWRSSNLTQDPLSLSLSRRKNEKKKKETRRTSADNSHSKWSSSLLVFLFKQEFPSFSSPKIQVGLLLIRKLSSEYC